MNLKQLLEQKGKNRWLDVGSGARLDKGFYYLDTYQENLLSPQKRKKYFRADILNLSNQMIKQMSKFDFIRMQHVFEHFTWEEGQICLKNCANLMKRDAYILITVPDLRAHIQKYLNNEYRKSNEPDKNDFSAWAQRRIPGNAPNSFYFSVFAHSMSFEPHKWCYDARGLIYQLKKTGKFSNIKELKISDELASKPFTHNRPEEDVCVIANLK